MGNERSLKAISNDQQISTLHFFYAIIAVFSSASACILAMPYNLKEEITILILPRFLVLNYTTSVIRILEIYASFKIEVTS